MHPTETQEHVRDEDIEFFERELASFIPDRVFDAHAHLWYDHKAPERLPPGFPTRAGYDDYMRLVDCMFPKRQVGAWFLPKPIKLKSRAEILRENEWIGEQVAGKPHARAPFLISPEDDPEWVREHAKRTGLCGFKCYHTMLNRPSSWEADIPEYLPERLVKVADEEGWVITLHMVKYRAAADPSNIHWIRHYCKNYPNMKLILAHSARGFQPAHNLEGLPQLTGFDNLYFECSTNCEPIAHQSIMRIMGHEKFMIGTDFGAASHGRGRPVAVADTFLWLQEKSPVWAEKHARIKPVMFALECLRSLKWACWSERLTDSQVEDIFWNNAARLFRLE